MILSYLFGWLLANVARRTEQSEMAVLAVLLAILDHVVVRLENRITTDTAKALGMPHLVQCGHKLGSKNSNS